MYFFIPCQLLLHLTVSYTAGDLLFLHPRSTRRGVYCFTSVRPKIFFVTFFSATIDGRNLIFGHKLHISAPYHGKCFWTCHIPTSCLPTWLVFIHIEHICGGITVLLVLSVIFGHLSLIPMRDFVSIKEQCTEENVLSIMSTVSQHTY